MNTKETIHNNHIRIDSLQTVRALAFLGIFTSHCGLNLLGAWGVSVFLVLSGFVMIYSYYDQNLDTSFKGCMKFSLNKVNKLYGLHIIMMICAMVYQVNMLIKDHSLDATVISFGVIFLNLTLLQSWVPLHWVYFSLNGVAWYLSVCLFLYMMFPVLHKVLKKIRYRDCYLLMIFIYTIQILVGFLSKFYTPSTYVGNFSKWVIYIFPLFRLGDFVIGCCLGRIFLDKEQKLEKKVANGCEILLFIGLFVTQYIYANRVGLGGYEWFRHTMLYTPTSVAMVWLFAKRSGIITNFLTCKPLVYLGNISAYMFLIHQIVIRYIDTVTKKLIGITGNVYVQAIIALIITVLGSEMYKRLKNKKKAAVRI